MEKFPQVPDLLFNGMAQLPHMAERIDAVAAEFSARKQQHQRTRRRQFIALLAFAGAGLLAWPQVGSSLSHWASNIHLGDISTGVYVLLAIGVSALFIKK